MALHLRSTNLRGLQTSCRAPRGTRAPAAQPAARLHCPRTAVKANAAHSRRDLSVRAESGSAVKGTVGSVTEENFKEIVLDSSIPVLVDFWAPWCGPCRMIAPIISELAGEYSDKILCVKLNTDESANIANEYGIRSIPTVIIFKDGVKMETVIGAVSKEVLMRSVENHL